MTALVFANGDMDEDHDWLRTFLDTAATVIAADGGTRHLMALGVHPDLVIGDLDSFLPEVREPLEAAGTRFLEHPRAKDETDLELALLYAAEHCEDPILVFASLGGRLDQMLANVLLLMHPALQVRSIRFVTRYQQIWLIHEKTRIEGEAGDTVSLIPIGGDVEVAETVGLEWRLHNETLSFGPARGLSNVMLGHEAEVKIKNGHLLVIHTRHGWGR